VEREAPNARASLNRLVSFHTSFTKINLAFTFWRSSGEVPGTSRHIFIKSSGEVLEKSLGSQSPAKSGRWKKIGKIFQNKKVIKFS
jgi:hypothetical protein